MPTDGCSVNVSQFIETYRYYGIKWCFCHACHSKCHPHDWVIWFYISTWNNWISFLFQVCHQQPVPKSQISTLATGCRHHFQCKRFRASPGTEGGISRQIYSGLWDPESLPLGKGSCSWPTFSREWKRSLWRHSSRKLQRVLQKLGLQTCDGIAMGCDLL